MNMKIGFLRNFIICGALLVAISGCNTKSILISISNESGSTISDIKIAYTGGSYVVHKMEPGMSNEQYIRPKGESHLELSFVDVRGMLIKTTIDVYIETGYEGSILITIGKDNKVSWKNNITIKETYGDVVSIYAFLLTNTPCSNKIPSCREKPALMFPEHCITSLSGG